MLNFHRLLVLFCLLATSSAAQFREVDHNAFCSDSDIKRETWVVVDIASDALTDTWIKDLLPSLRSSMHSGETLRLLSYDTEKGISINQEVTSCSVVATSEEIAKCEASKGVFDRLISDCRAEIKSAENKYLVSLASTLKQIDSERQGLDASIRDRAHHLFSLVYPRLEEMRLKNLASKDPRFIRVIFLGSPFEISVIQRNAQSAFELNQILNGFSNEFTIGAIEIRALGTKDDKHQFGGRQFTSSELQKLIFGRLGVLNFEASGSLQAPRVGSRLSGGVSQKGTWKVEQNDTGAYSEIELFFDTTSRVKAGRILLQSVQGLVSVPIVGSYDCSDETCSFSGTVASNVPFGNLSTATPLFYENDSIRLSGIESEKKLNGEIIAGAAFSGSNEGSNKYVLEFIK